MSVKKLIGFWIAMLYCSTHLLAAGKITAAQIREVMAAADLASQQRDTKAIGACLGEKFFKYIDVPMDKLPATVRIDKDQYLGLIERGWDRIENYAYQRKDVVVNVAPDGLSGESSSTVIETFTVDGAETVSKVREYARYELEDGRPVIVTVQTQTLVGDTTSQ
ncbi:MAG: hypothetical protein PVF07_04155 [Thiogranum sp.]|jgi:hypothetical protein